MSGEMSIWLILWEASLVVKLVLLLLVFCSVFSWALIIKKRKQLKGAREANQEFLRVYSKEEDLNDLRIKADLIKEGPFHYLFISSSKELDRVRKWQEGVYGKIASSEIILRENLERSLDKAISETSSVLSKSLSLLASIGSISPFIGLFGTVWGIVGSFQGLSAGGSGIDAVAPGIAEALVATAIGLFAAIPAVFFFNQFSTEVQRMAKEMNELGLELLNRYQLRVR